MSGHSHSLARDICADLDGPIVGHTLDREHGGDVYAWAERARIDPAEIIDFSASINPLGPPFRPALFKKATTRYRAIPTLMERLRRLAKRHEMKPTEILVGNGSTQLVTPLLRSAAPQGTGGGARVLQHASALALAGAKSASCLLRRMLI
jgi:histidinol-phosphate/aromatic aminotransferase/cobyric acid decarboxylase-like protein